MKFLTAVFCLLGLMPVSVFAATECQSLDCEVERTPPPVPSSISYSTPDSAGNYVVSWSQVAGANTYYVLEEKIGTGNWLSVPNIVGTSKGFAKAPGSYQYRVQTCATNFRYEGCSFGYRTGTVLTIAAPPPPPPPPPSQASPVIDHVQTEKAFTWVLIHSDVPFLIPAFAQAKDGAATVTWGAVAGAQRYEVRLLINGQWTGWVSVGSDTFYNFYNEDHVSIGFEVRACDAAGCGAASSRSITLSSWRNLGTCNPNTGEQQQVCIAGSCLHSTRYVQRCSQNIVCNIP